MRQGPQRAISWRDRRLARQEKSEAKHLRMLDEIMNTPPASWAGWVAYWTGRWLALTLVWAGIAALVTRTIFKASGLAVLVGLGSVILSSILHVTRGLASYEPFPGRRRIKEERVRWLAEREPFLRIAVVSKRNPSGKALDEYPVACRSLIEDLTNIAGEISAPIAVTECTDDSITIDTGPYFADSIRKNLSDRAAEDHKRLALNTHIIPKLDT